MAPAEQNPKHKILLLDDDPDVLDLYQESLLQLASEPEVHISTSGARAMALLESEPFHLLICDIHMPKMDGLQVLAIVRRKFPQLRTIVLTGVADEQMRTRAYAMGIDLYLEKPGNSKELSFMLECVESLLGKEMAGGFRGIQSKSLVDLIQLECLSGSSSVLKIVNGALEGRIWIQNGELIDAATGEVQGEEAFKRIVAWKTGTFELLPIEVERPKKIHTSYQGLLLDSVQAMDEANAQPPSPEPEKAEKLSDTQFFKKAGLGRIQGVEFALKIPEDPSIAPHAWGREDANGYANWIRSAMTQLERLGEKFEFGPVQTVDGKGPRRVLHVNSHGDYLFAIGMIGNPSREEVESNLQKVLERWGS